MATSHPAQSGGRRAWRIFLVAMHSMALVAVFLVALTAGILALSGVAEIDARRHYRTLMEEQLGRFQEGLAATVDARDADSLRSKAVLRQAIARTKDRLLQLRELSEAGAVSGDGTLRCLRSARSEGCGSSAQGENRILGALRRIGYVPATLRDDSILAGVVIFSSIFGTCLSALRSRKLGFSGLAAGSVGGILVFFLIKGGKVFFMLGDESEWSQYNPYSFAVAGILAGLFADAAFRSLTAATESLLERLTLAFEQRPTGAQVQGAHAATSREARGGWPGDAPDDAASARGADAGLTHIR